MSDWSVDWYEIYLVKSGKNKGAKKSTYYDVLTGKCPRVRDASLHMPSAWNLVAHPHRNITEQREVDEGVEALLVRVVVVDLVIIIIVAV
jgi:hypothetical protein